eukprot:1160551-Pelagomonas_calceolata.AAC.4
MQAHRGTCMHSNTCTMPLLHIFRTSHVAPDANHARPPGHMYASQHMHSDALQNMHVSMWLLMGMMLMGRGTPSQHVLTSMHNDSTALNTAIGDVAAHNYDEVVAHHHSMLTSMHNGNTALNTAIGDVAAQVNLGAPLRATCPALAFPGPTAQHGSPRSVGGGLRACHRMVVPGVTCAQQPSLRTSERLLKDL